MTEPGLQLPPQCTLRDADELKSSLSALVELPHDVTIDGSVVERVDTATLQLLVAFVATRRANGRVVRWRAPRESLLVAARQLGLHDSLHLAERA